MLLEDNMTRYTNTFRDRIPTTITLVFSAITKEITHTSPRFKFTMFMRLKKNKIDTTKNSKRTIIWGGMIKTLKGSNVTKNRRRESIDNMNNSKNIFTPSTLRTRRRKKHCTNRVKNVTVFAFSSAILLRRTRARKLIQGTLFCKKG